MSLIETIIDRAYSTPQSDHVWMFWDEFTQLAASTGLSAKYPHRATVLGRQVRIIDEDNIPAEVIR